MLNFESGSHNRAAAFAVSPLAVYFGQEFTPACLRHSGRPSAMLPFFGRQNPQSASHFWQASKKRSFY